MKRTTEKSEKILYRLQRKLNIEASELKRYKSVQQQRDGNNLFASYAKMLYRKHVETKTNFGQESGQNKINTKEM